jgi:hypothetical protein
MNEIIEIFWKNARGDYDSWGLTFLGWVAVILLAGFGIWKFFHWINVEIAKDTAEERQKIKSLGYKDLDDIKVFLERIDSDYSDFIKSKGIRKQYEVFSEGKTSNFIETAQASKKASDAESSGMTTGLAAGLATGVVINSGHH